MSGRDAFKGVWDHAPNLNPYSDRPFWTDGVQIPKGRETANGKHPIIIFSTAAYLAGRSASRSAKIEIGSASTSTFSVGHSSSRKWTGFKSIDAYFSDGGTTRVTITPVGGSIYFGRGNGAGGSTVDDRGTRWGGGIAGQFNWIDSPSAPRSLSARGTSTTIVLDWSTPTTDGDSAITDYIVEWSTTSNFASVTRTSTVGPVSNYTVSGLGTGTYYFRVAARNAVTNRASTWSKYSTTVSGRRTGYAPPGDPDPVYSVPATPNGLVAVPGPNQAHVTWNPTATQPGVPILDWQLQYDDNSGFTSPATLTLTAAARSHTVTDLPVGSTQYFRIRARNSVGYSAWSSTASATLPTRSYLGSIGTASLHLSDGTQVELRSNGAASPTITLGYIAVNGGTIFNTIGSVPVGDSAGLIAVPENIDAVAMVASPRGDIYILGREGGTTSNVIVKHYRKGTGLTWTLVGSRSETLGTGTKPLSQFSATYMTGTVDSILVLTRRVGTLGPGNLSFATIRVSAITSSSSYDLFIQSGTDPSWLATPPATSGYTNGLLGVASLSDTRAAIFANGHAIVDVADGIVSSVAKSRPGGWWGDKTRVIRTGSTTFAVLYSSDSMLYLEFYNTNGNLLYTYQYWSGMAWLGFDQNWDAFYNREENRLYIYYVPYQNSIAVYRFGITPETYAETPIQSVTGGAGPGGFHHGLRLPQGGIDERHLVVALANLNISTQSLQTVSDTLGNLAPLGPALDRKDSFDADYAQSFSWTFGDPNDNDYQTAMQFKVETLAGAVVYDTGKVTRTQENWTVDADGLVDNTEYRWAVKTWDVLNTEGAWSRYGFFRTADQGLVTITDPATDNEPLAEDHRAVVWSYSTTDDSTQAQFRLRLSETATGLQVYDAPWYPGSVNTHTVGLLQSGVEYLVEVWVLNTRGVLSEVATRLITPDYTEPAEPDFELIAYAEFTRLTITNPEEGDRPLVVRNDIYRREMGDVDYILIGSTDPEGVYDDYTVASGRTYEYVVRAIGDENAF